jgi:hypothetical protein
MLLSRMIVGLHVQFKGKNTHIYEIGVKGVRHLEFRPNITWIFPICDLAIN